jgi:peptide/nickel transport system permease protein
MDLRNRLSAPGDAAHWLGTDELGRDVLSRLIFSIRISLLIAFGATAISAIVGTLLGFLAAHFRGLAEQAVLMLANFQASMPFLILALAVLAFFGSSLPLLIGLMGFYGWERYARIARVGNLRSRAGSPQPSGNSAQRRRDLTAPFFPTSRPR